MSFFKDDFYTAKVSRRIRWGQGGRRGSALWGNKGLIGIVFASAFAGALLAVLIMPLVVGKGYFSGASPREEAVAALANPTQTGENNSVIQAVAEVRPAVVSVISSVEDGGESQELGLGSGVIFQKAGNRAEIVTNAHVVEGGTAFEVILSTSEHKKAELIGKDTLTDLAVLEVDAKNVGSIAEFGDSDQLESGETAIAIGNPLGLGFSQSTTVGVISSPSRLLPISQAQNGDYDWELNVIQTDAAINVGNSGGALANIDGKVIGINSMKISFTGVEGLGFAIPINDVKPIIASILEYGKVMRPFIGIVSQNLESYEDVDALKLPGDVKTGIIVIESLGPAAEAGLKSGDVIVQMDNTVINNVMEMREYLYNQKKIGDSLAVTYYREGKKNTVSFTLAEKTDE